MLPLFFSQLQNSRPKTIFLFDVDGTLTPSRQQMPDNIKQMLTDIREKVYIAFVGALT